MHEVTLANLRAYVTFTVSGIGEIEWPTEFQGQYPPPSPEIPPPCKPTPPPRGGRQRPSLHYCTLQHLLRWFVFPICHTQVLALFSHYFYSVRWAKMKRGMMRSFLAVLSPSGPHISLWGGFQGRVHKECICINRSASIAVFLLWFALVKVCKVHGATAQSVLFSSMLVPRNSIPFFWTPIPSVLHESCWHSLNANFASLVFYLLASMEGTTVSLEIPLQSRLPNWMGDRRALRGEISTGGGGVLGTTLPT